MKIPKSKQTQECVEEQKCWVDSKKSAQQGRRQILTWSVLAVREHSKLATCLCEAASAGMEPLACQP